MNSTRLFLSFLILVVGGLSLPSARAARWEKRAAEYVGYDRTNPPPRGGVVFTGSSSIDMWRTLHADFPELPIVNRGIGGTWLADVTEFAPQLVYPLRPHVIVLYAGENDLASDRTVDQVVAAFQAVLAQIRQNAPDVRLVFLSLKPSPRREALLAKMKEANRRLAQLCAQDPLCRFVDVFTPMLNARGVARAELFLADRLHMNAEGYKLWTQLLRPILNEIALSSPAPAPSAHGNPAG
jgi:lysophospholipase L1-like esterase